jgi:hypothetical protein
MSDDTKDVISSNVVELIDRDSQIFRLRLAGLSVKKIARQFRLPVEQVEMIVKGMCTPVNLQMKAHGFELELERLDELQAAFYDDALKGDVPAAAITLKILERRAAMLGHDAVRQDPVQLIASAQPQQSSTDRIRAALDRIAGKSPANGDGGINGEPSPAA